MKKLAKLLLSVGIALVGATVGTAIMILILSVVTVPIVRGVGVGVALDGSTLAAIVAVVGTLVGTISLLFRQLISAKDAQIAALMNQIATLTVERDLFRDRLLDRLARSGSRAS